MWVGDGADELNNSLRVYFTGSLYSKSIPVGNRERHIPDKQCGIALSIVGLC